MTDLDIDHVIGPTRTAQDGPVDRLYRDHANNLIAWLRRRYGEGPPDPEDIAHAAFAKLASLDSLDHIANHRAFVFTIAANLAITGIRARNRAHAFAERELADDGMEIENITPERVCESRERFDRLAAAFATLTERQKDFLIRVRIHGQTYAEIRDATGWSLGAIAGDIKTAMLALAAAIET